MNYTGLFNIYCNLLPKEAARTRHILEALRKEKGDEAFFCFLETASEADFRKLPKSGMLSTAALCEFQKALFNYDESAWEPDLFSVLVDDDINTEESSKRSTPDLITRGRDFQFFNILEKRISKFSERHKRIICELLNVYSRAEEQELDSIRHMGRPRNERMLQLASEMGLSRERVRQLKLSCLEKIDEECRKLKSIHGLRNCPYDLADINLSDVVNTIEGTDFSRDFICYALSVAYDDVSLVGDAVECLVMHRKSHKVLVAVPSETADSYDFDAFIQRVEDLVSAKRKDGEQVDLSALENNGNAISEIDDIFCRLILALAYPGLLDGEKLVLPANMEKSEPEKVEFILRAAGHPLTISEMLDMYKSMFPGRNKSISQLRANVLCNSNIVAISRSSTYTLREWEDSDSLRGGSLRSFVHEYLEVADNHEAPFHEVCEYVRRFRPSTKNETLMSNLLLDSKRRWSFFKKNGVNWIMDETGEYL